MVPQATAAIPMSQMRLNNGVQPMEQVGSRAWVSPRGRKPGQNGYLLPQNRLSQTIEA